MTRVDTKTILYMVAKEFDLARNTTEDRLKLQKTIYLLQANGLQLGYGFSWYKYGPYSQDLVYDAHTVLKAERNEYEAIAGPLKFNETSEKRFKEFKEICKDILGSTQDLELAASVDFVQRTWYPDADENDIPDRIRMHKEKLFGDTTPITNDKILKAFRICRKLRAKRN